MSAPLRCKAFRTSHCTFVERAQVAVAQCARHCLFGPREIAGERERERKRVRGSLCKFVGRRGEREQTTVEQAHCGHKSDYVRFERAAARLASAQKCRGGAPIPTKHAWRRLAPEAERRQPLAAITYSLWFGSTGNLLRLRTANCKLRQASQPACRLSLSQRARSRAQSGARANLRNSRRGVFVSFECAIRGCCCGGGDGGGISGTARRLGLTLSARAGRSHGLRALDGPADWGGRGSRDRAERPHRAKSAFRRRRRRRPLAPSRRLDRAGRPAGKAARPPPTRAARRRVVCSRARSRKATTATRPRNLSACCRAHSNSARHRRRRRRNRRRVWLARLGSARSEFRARLCRASRSERKPSAPQNSACNLSALAVCANSHRR